MPGKFVVKKGSTGQFRFSLLARNGQVVATSETYKTKAACMNGIKSVRNYAAEAAVEDQTTKEWAAEQEAKKAAGAKKASKKAPGAKKAPAAKKTRA